LQLNILILQKFEQSVCKVLLVGIQVGLQDKSLCLLLQTDSMPQTTRCQVQSVLLLLVIDAALNQRLLGECIWNNTVGQHVVKLFKGFVNVSDVDTRLDDTGLVYQPWFNVLFLHFVFNIKRLFELLGLGLDLDQNRECHTGREHVQLHHLY